MKIYNKLNCQIKIEKHHLEASSSIELPSDEAKKLLAKYPNFLEEKKDKSKKKK